MKKTVVYTGPTLSIAEAKHFLPDAQFHEPVQCGDIIKILRTGCERIVIIDGYFEQRAAVWHKEILYALSLGISVFGASSMGALRASELDAFGMQGFGKIYEQYRDGDTLDDDEVALVHSDDQFDSAITPMVNVRATIKQGIHQGRIEQSQAIALLGEIKSQPYYNRSLFNSTPDEELNNWFKENYLDQKKLDAIALLEYLNTSDSDHQPPSFNSSLFFNKIYREMMCEPFTHAYDWLPGSERQLVQANQHFSQTQRIAKLMHLNFDRPDFIGSPDDLLSFMDEKAANCQADQEAFIFYLLVESGQYDKLFKDELYSVEAFKSKAPELHQLTELLSTCLMSLIEYMQTHDFHISERFAQRYADHFRRERELMSVETTFEWMKEHDLEKQDEFEALITHLSVLHHIVDNHNAHSIGLPTSLNRFNWLEHTSKLASSLDKACL